MATVEQYQRLKSDPLCHPGVFARECLDHSFEIPSHLREIYHSVFQATDDRYPNAPKNLGRLMPREHGKSEVGSVIVPTWAALRNPNTRILIMMETEGQAKGKLRECRDHIERLAPQFGRTIQESNKTELTLERDQAHDVPTIKAAGFETGITGGHFDILSFDDIISWESQRTEARREKKWQMFQDYQNLGSRGDSVFLVLGTRKHPRDLYSHLIEGIGWDTVVRRAISDWSIIEEGEFTVTTDLENRYTGDSIQGIDGERETVVDVQPHRDVDVLWPERWPLSALISDLISGYGREQGTLVWRRENQNDAEALQGQILSGDMLTFVDRLPKRKRDYSWYAGLDPAVEDDPEKAAQNDTDYWGLAIVAYDRSDDVAYIPDIFRRRGMSLAKGISWVRDSLNSYPNVSKCIVESQQAQRWFVQEGKDAGLTLESTTSSGSKEERIISMSARFESDKVQIVGDAASSSKWESFVDEWASFPTGDHDDRLDACEIALRAIEDMPAEIPSTW